MPLAPRHAGSSRTCLVAALALLLSTFGSAAAGAAARMQRIAGAQRVAEPQSSTASDAQATRLDDTVAEAQAAQAAGQYTAAATAYAKATTLDATIPELWANRGLMEHLAGQPGKAIASFQHALAGKPNLFTAVLFTGIDLAALDQPRQAIPWLNRALRLQSANPDALLALGKSYTALGRLDEASATLEKAVTSSPVSSGAWFSLAMVRLALIDRDGGRLARDHSTDPWSQALYAQDLLVQGRTSEAIDAFHQAASKATPRQRAVFAALLTSTASPQADTPQPAITRVLAAVDGTSSPAEVCPAPATQGDRSPACSYLHGDAAGAATQAAARLQVHPDDTEALFWSVKANEPLSVTALSTFESLAPQSPATFDLMGDLFRRRLQPDRALAEYARALATESHDAPALLGTAAAYLATGRSKEAANAASLALADRPDSPRLNLLMGEALVAQHQFSAARPYVDRALTSAQSDGGEASSAALLPAAYALSGQIKSDAGDLNGAIADLALGLPSDTDGSLSFQLSRLYRRQGMKDQADRAEAHAKSLLAARRAHAVTAVQSSLDATPDGTP